MSGLTAEQIAYRRKYVCGSDAAEIMAGNLIEMWKIKTGRMEEPDLYDKLSPELDYHVLKHFTRERLELTRLLGHATEPLNAFWYERQTGRAVERRAEWAVCPEPEYAFMAAHLDGVTTTARGALCYWDAKWTGRLDEAFVLRHTPQGVHNATIIGADWWGLSVFVGNGKWEWIEQPVDPLYQAELIAKEREFWGYVERDEEPLEDVAPTAPPKPQPRLREVVVPSDNPDMLAVLVAQNNWLPDALKEARRLIDTDGAAKVNAIARKGLADLVPEDVGLLAWGRYRGSRDKAGVLRSTVKPMEKDDAETS